MYKFYEYIEYIYVYDQSYTKLKQIRDKTFRREDMNLIINRPAQMFTGKRQLKSVPEPLTKQIEMAAKEVESGKPSYSAANLILNVLKMTNPELPQALESNMAVATSLSGVTKDCFGPMRR